MQKYFKILKILIIVGGIVFPSFIVLAQGVQTQTGDVILRAIVPAIPIIPQPPIGGGTQLMIYDVEILEITTSSALITWKTNLPATSYIKYGKTNNLEIREIFDPAFKTEHQVRLTNLEMNTLYYFKLKATSELGASAETGIYSFKTLGIPLSNVRDFVAIGEMYQIRLLWKNPPDRDFKGVRIMKSTEFFPLSPYDGNLVYDGSGETHIDKDVTPCIRYYYTAFAYDIYGNFASGAVASAVPLPCPAPPPIPWPPYITRFLKITDFKFRIAQKTIDVPPDPLNIFHFLPGTILNVSIEPPKLPQVLKAIIIVVNDKSYLLRIDDTEQTYQASLVLPLGESLQQIYILVLNFQDGTMDKVEGNILIEPFGVIKEEPQTLGNNQVGAKEETAPIYLAKTTLYQYDEGLQNWQVWPAERYSQKNPIYSNPEGQYGFLVPKGKYIVEVEKENFTASRTKEFEVDKNFINQDIILKQFRTSTPLERLRWIRIIILLLLLIVAAYIWYRKRRKPLALIPVIPSKEEKKKKRNIYVQKQ